MEECLLQREVLEIAPYKSLRHCIFSLNALETRREQAEALKEEYGAYLHKKLAIPRALILGSLILFNGFSIYSERQNISNGLRNVAASISQKYEAVRDFPNSLLKDRQIEGKLLE